MKYPTVPLAELSQDALTLYKIGAGSSLPLDRDWFAPNAHRMSQYALLPGFKPDPDFQPDQRLRAAIDELVAAGFVSDPSGNTLWITRVASDYTLAVGDGPWSITVSLVNRPGQYKAEGLLRVVLEGAELDTSEQTYGGPNVRLATYVPNALDFEHSSAYSASIELRLPTFPMISTTQIRLWGMIANAHLYPLGTDPLLLDDHSNEAITEPVRCELDQCSDEHEGGSPHFIAPYLPPQVDALTGALVCVEASIRDTSAH